MTQPTARLKRLYLLRHAKSSWDDTSLADFDRPLNGRGRAAAKSMGAYMAQHGHSPALILCSSARRTLETLGRILPFLAGDREIRILRTLYAARDADQLLGEVQAAGGRAKSVMVIGHNPVLEDLATQLAGTDSGGCLPMIQEKYPTGALALLTHKRAWKTLGHGDADLLEFTAPREL